MGTPLFFVGRRFEEERSRLGYTQISLGKVLDLTREQIGKYERGINWPGGEVLFSFAQHGADVLYIITNERKSASPAAFNPILLRQVVKDAEEALEAARIRMPPAKKGELIALLYDHFKGTQTVERATVKRFLQLVA